jgi:hypothetical protein
MTCCWTESKWRSVTWSRNKRLGRGWTPEAHASALSDNDDDDDEDDGANDDEPLPPSLMGNSASSSSRSAHDDSVDYGFLTPQGVYSGPRDWNEQVVGRLIAERKLAPFYRPLDDYDDAWDADKILAARKELPAPPVADGDPARPDPPPSAASRHSHHHKRSATAKDAGVNPEAAIYRGAVECPICFLVRACSSTAPYVSQSTVPSPHPPSTTALPTEHQPLALLRPDHLHRVLRPDPPLRTDRHSPRVRPRMLPVLRPGALWCCVRAPGVARRPR